MNPIGQLIRIKNLAFLAIALLGVSLFAANIVDSSSFKTSFFLSAIVFTYTLCTVAASGYVINDIFDVETDKINKPEKQIIGVLMPVSYANWLYAALLIDALLVAWLFEWISGKFGLLIIVLLTQFLLYLYAKYLKRVLFVGNLLVAALTALPYLIFIYIFEISGFHFKVITLFACFAFILNLIREVVKDWQDINGDMAIQAKTIPIVFGIKSTKNLIFYLLILSLILHVLAPVFLLDNGPWNLFIAATPVFLVGLLHLIAMKSMRLWSAEKLSKFLKTLMFFGVLWMYYLLLFL
jgi:4-hydroxybenzoate polyprenyltransferase